MSDEALIPFGKYAKKLCGIRVGGAGDPYKRDSEEARRNGEDDTKAWLTNIESASVVNCNS